MKILKFLVFICIGVSIISCEKDNTGDGKDYNNGVIITNEGNFQSSNASVSFYSFNTGTLSNNIFLEANGRVAGDVIQSFCRAGDYGFIVVNNSQKVEIVDLKTFKVVSEPISASYPRHMISVDEDKAYLTNGNYGGYVYIIDLNALEISDSVAVGNGPERLLKVGNYVFVANSGGWLYDSTLSVINYATDELVETIIVGDMPIDMVLDKDNMLWVMCNGKLIYDYETYDVIGKTSSKLVQLDPQTFEIKQSIEMGDPGDASNPLKLEISPDGDYLYIAHLEGIYKIPVDNVIVPDHYFIDKTTYGFNVNPDNGDLYVLTSPSFTSGGTLFIYDEDGKQILESTVGINPNGSYFP